MRALTIAIAALFVASCGGSAAAPSKAPLPATSAEAAAKGPWTAGAAAEDEPFRYVIPDPTHLPPFSPPQVLRAKTEAGTTLLVVEDHKLPLVSIALHAKFQGEPRVPGARLAWLVALLDGALQTAKPPLGVMPEGLEVKGSVDLDAMSLTVNAPAKLAREVIETLVGAARRGALGEASLVTLRERRRAIERELTARDRAWMVADEVLFPAGHPYHGHRWGTIEALDKMTIADLEQDRRDALAPDSVTVVAVGDIGVRDVEDAVGHDEKAHPPEKAAAKKNEKRRVEMGSGAVIADDRIASSSEIVVGFSRRGTDQDPLASALVSALRGALREPEGVPASWADVVVTDRTIGDTSTLQLSVRVAPGDVNLALKAIKKRLDDVRERGAEAGDLSPVAWQEWLVANYDGAKGSRDRLVILLDRHVGPESEAPLYASLLAYEPEKTIAFAREVLDPKRGVVVVASPAAVDPKDLLALGFGPVTRTKVARPEGDKP